MKIGITGGIGSGKTYVANFLKKKRFPVYSCDDRARIIMKEDESIKAELIKLIGEDAYLEDGNLNKPVIAKYLYETKEHQEQIGALVHPRVRTDFEMWCNFQDSEVVFMESAILYESGLADAVDKVLYVFASDEVRVRRIIQRDKITRNEAHARIKAQMPEAVKMKLADYCIINNGNNNILKQLQNIQI